jgi:RNA-directed DNA polymerase
VAHGTHGRAGDAGPHVWVDGKTGETVRAPTVTTQRQPMAEQAARDPDRGFWTLAHLIDEDCLREAYRPTSQSRAAGLAGGTAPRYAEHLDANRRALHARLRSGRSQAAPVARVWMEKDDGRQRPIGKPTCEEKMVHRAGARRLAAIYEQAFSDGA